MIDDLSALRVLVVDDEPDVRLGLLRLVRSLGADVRAAASGDEALRIVEAVPVDVVVSDVCMPGLTGVELLREVARVRPRTAVVLITGFGTIEMAVSCLRHGAAHFLTKPFDNDELVRTVERLGRKALAEARTEVVADDDFVVADQAMLRLLGAVDSVAPTRMTVLIEGASGTGKERIARRIHQRSGSSGAFVPVNCAAIPEALAEAEMFGHRRGAFTGADSDRDGLFVQADGGTVFLDEVGSMPLAVQGRLLRVLQDRIVRPVGSDQSRPVDFRVVAATNRDLGPLCAEEAFRSDLYYRLRGVVVHIPTLRERPADVPALAIHFLRRAAAAYLPAGAPCPALTPAAMDEICAHDWPGNVRELGHAIERAVVSCQGDAILPHHLALEEPAGQDGERGEDSYEFGKQRAIERFQRGFVLRALERTGGNVTRAAEECGMTRAALQRILKGLGIDRATFTRPE